MRVADKMNYGQSLKNINQSRSEMAASQNQLATMKRVTKPSDDPVAATRTLGARTELHAMDQFMRNIQGAQSFVQLTDQSLGEATDLMVRLKELAIQEANEASANETTRKAVATEAKQIYEELLTIANRQFGDRYLFGGYKTKSKPVNEVGAYQGDEGELRVEIGKNTTLAMNIPASRVFFGSVLNSNRGDSKALDPRVVEDLYDPARIDKPAQVPKQFGEDENIQIRGPAAIDAAEAKQIADDGKKIVQGENVFNSLKTFIVGLETNETSVIQDSITRLDDSMNQIITARSQVGARARMLDNAMASLQKQTVDSKGMISELEDADVFKVASDITQHESALKATLDTSGHLVRLSLLDFLR